MNIAQILSTCRNSGLSAFMETAVGAALAAGGVLEDRFGRPLQVRHKGDIDLVTEADLASEKKILEILGEFSPGTPILTEEDPSLRTSIRETGCWIVDPLDGTTNFAHGFPWYAVSIAFGGTKGIEAGVIYAPYQKDLFYAVKGHGAWRNGERIRISHVTRLREALLATGFPYDVQTCTDPVMDALKAVIKNAQGVRRAGAAALDLAYVACGRLDGFWEVKLKPWDTAAGMLLVEEAGGKVTDFGAGPYDPFIPEILATNSRIHEELSRILAAFGRTP